MWYSRVSICCLSFLVLTCSYKLMLVTHALWISWLVEVHVWTQLTKYFTPTLLALLHSPSIKLSHEAEKSDIGGDKRGIGFYLQAIKNNKLSFKIIILTVLFQWDNVISHCITSISIISNCLMSSFNASVSTHFWWWCC